jgi:hypothetical protein
MCGSLGLSRSPPLTFVPHHGAFGVPSPSGALHGRIVRERDPRALSSPTETTAPSCPSGRDFGGLPTISRWSAALRRLSGRTPLLGLSKDRPSIDISFACPLPAPTTSRTKFGAPSALDCHIQDSFRPCRSSRLRRLAPRAALQVCCTLLPTMGFVTFQARRGRPLPRNASPAPSPGCAIRAPGACLARRPSPVLPPRRTS